MPAHAFPSFGWGLQCVPFPSQGLPVHTLCPKPLPPPPCTCLVLCRWAAPYTLFPFYYLLWSPRWWTHIPLAVLGLGFAMMGESTGESTEAQLAVLASICLTVW